MRRGHPETSRSNSMTQATSWFKVLPPTPIVSNMGGVGRARVYERSCQVSPDERFEEIVGVSDTFVPAANVWVGEYPYLDKVKNK